MDSGSVLLAGFLKELERSNCVFFENSYQVLVHPSEKPAWLCYVALRSGVPWAFQDVLILSHAGERHIFLQPLLWPLPVQSPPPGSASRPVGRMAGCVQRNQKAQVCPHRGQTWDVVCTLGLLLGCSRQNLICPLSLGHASPSLENPPCGFQCVHCHPA